MTSLLVIFRSLSQVYLVKKRLAREGLYLDMVRVPQCAATMGCSFALRCAERDLSRVSRAGTACSLEPAAVIPEPDDGLRSHAGTDWQDEA